MRLEFWEPLGTSRVDAWYLIIGNDVWSHDPHANETTHAGGYENFNPAWESGARQHRSPEGVPREMLCEMLRLISMYKLHPAVSSGDMVGIRV